MAVAVQSQESGGAAHLGTVSGTASTWSFNNVSGTFAIMAVTLSTGGSAAITQVRYNSVDFIPIGSPISYSAGAIMLQLFWLRNPATGTNTASVTGTGSATFHIFSSMITFTGVEATAWPVGSPNTNTDTRSGTSTSDLTPLTAQSTSMVVGCGAWGSGEASTAGQNGADSGWTKSAELVNSGGTPGDNHCLFYKAGTGSAITPGFDWPSNDQYGVIGVEIYATLPTFSDARFAPFRR